ncbi:tRNA (guanosine(37)-N1)-methyltransferase TrmD [Rappaport israeli]|uniref:tRNA (guanosine(37)-N1)-methyltransferase TrmD n=1 Tax=Rappaport israeli TaxID=1839807 RepID=UPI000930F768|nr:tRNA (guanosine(37)-N1)-methyltransferase TrmD [Rappaport israeli]
MNIHIISIFPQLLAHWFSQGVISRALSQTTLAKLHYWNPRNYSHDKHQRIDDRPFGGGPGMVMQYQPLADTAKAINTQATEKPFHIALSPQGEMFNQQLANQLAEKPALAFWCGRYEGIDQRFLDQHIDLEVSIGDFVLSGGEIAAAIMIDSILRLIPGILGDEQSFQQDSFQQKLLDHPHYTRPQNIGRIRTPSVLLSGNHAAITRWRLQQSLGRTFLLRPDLLDNLILTDEQQTLLNEFLAQQTFSGEPS